MNTHITYSMWSSRGDTFTVSTLSMVSLYDNEQIDNNRVTIIAVEVASDVHFVQNLLNTICQHQSVYVTSIGIDGPVAVLQDIIWSLDTKREVIDTSSIWRTKLVAYNLHTLNESLYALCCLVINKKAPMLILRPYAPFDGRIALLLQHPELDQTHQMQCLNEVRVSNV